MKAMADAGYIFDFEKKKLKKIDWNPQLGDIFRKKGTTSPTYHLCNKREDGITFGFVENREVGIAGGEITIFALKNDYELVERLKSIEDVIEKELNKELQTKVEQKSSWSEEDESMRTRCIGILGKCYMGELPTKVEEELNWLKSLKEKYTWKPSDEQMEYLLTIKTLSPSPLLESLYIDLKKLRDE